MTKLVKVMNTSDLKSGECKLVEVEGEEIAIYRVGSEFFATSNICPHQSGPLAEGSLEGDVVTCPWHGWKFNVKSGVSPVAPTVKVQTYKVKVEGDEVKVEVD